jgi:hypothetical protein
MKKLFSLFAVLGALLCAAPVFAQSTSIWGPTETPVTINQYTAYEMGTRFYSDTPGYVIALRFYKISGATGIRTGTLWKADGTQLAQVTFANETASGWQTQMLTTPVFLQAGVSYVVSYHSSVSSLFGYTLNYFQSAGKDSPPLHAPKDVPTTGPFNGANNPTGGVFPNGLALAAYFIDVVFVPGYCGVFQ